MATTVDKTADTTRYDSVNYGERSLGVLHAKTVSYSDFDASTDIVQLFTIPANSFIRDVFVVVTTAFNAATTNVLVVGDGTDPDGYIGANDVNEASAAVVGSAISTDGSGAYVAKAVRPFYSSADTLDVTYTWTGDDPTAGQATIIAEIVTLP